MTGAISHQRRLLHADLLKDLITIDKDGIPSIADRGSNPSKAIASQLVSKMGSALTAEKLAGQTSGAKFETKVAEFSAASFRLLTHLRPGEFQVEIGGGIARFSQYAHLDDLQALANSNREIATAIGADYLIKPDIVIFRRPIGDSVINSLNAVVDLETARLTPVRLVNSDRDLLHASISCKFTLRSDRAQNARSEGLNLVRNRKGTLPHIMTVTAEPLPTRIASLALGTGDIDCVYHVALPELRSVLAEQERDDQLELLETMVNGNRLRDVSDLPLDLVT